MPDATAEQHKREHWGSRVGLILAMAGNAVGLGNFLRFPVQAAENGGGTFMIPYFISFIVLGIPIMWMEWGIGRYGGRYGEGSVPGMFNRIWKSRAAKYVGVLGLLLPMIVFSYYTVIIGWLLGFSFFSLTGGYFGLTTEGVAEFLASFQNIHEASIHGGWVGFLFFAITMAFVVWILSRGISGGIEKLALWGMPILFIFGLILMIRILTLPETAAGSPEQGLAFIWTPDWSKLGNPNVWVAAAGQVFFTLSLGLGSIHVYASYLSEDDDITLTGLATASTNEMAEVVLGGTIAIPAAVTFFGITGATALAAGGSFDLGIVAMATVFQNLPGGEMIGRLMAFMWFFLLFIAGITSSVALATPAMSFMQEEFGFTRKRTALGLGAVVLLLGFANVWWLAGGFLDEWDQWAALGFIVFAFIEVWMIRLAFGMDEFIDEMHIGADLRIPGFFRFTMKWITPLFLTGLLIWYAAESGLPLIMMAGVPAENVSTLWIARGFMVAMLLVGLWLINRAWKRNPDEERIKRTESSRPEVV
ncbi:MAG TPA: sodium-dependent transporter [Longimicrobiaceae bacterium]|nr:sodium-dependent transporter [Longimicrobiaceae bacterium]